MTTNDLRIGPAKQLGPLQVWPLIWEGLIAHNYKVPPNLDDLIFGEIDDEDGPWVDYIGNGQIRQGTHFLSQFPQTYEQGVLAALGQNISRIGAIYLLTKSEIWEKLYLSEELEGVLEPLTT